LMNPSNDVSGVSFSYQFSGMPRGDQLQIYVGQQGNLNEGTYFDMNDEVAAALPSSGTLTGTFGIGYEVSNYPVDLVFVLRAPDGVNDSDPVSVTVNNFQMFTLG